MLSNSASSLVRFNYAQNNILDNDVMGFCVSLAVIGVFAMVYIVLLNSNFNRST